jgi:hypothetical protein
MKRPCRSRLSSAAVSQGSSRTCSAATASAATQLAALIATSIVQAQFAPRSTGLAAIQSESCAPSSSR